MAAAGQVGKAAERRAVAPMQILEDEDQRIQSSRALRLLPRAREACARDAQGPGAPFHREPARAGGGASSVHVRAARGRAARSRRARAVRALRGLAGTVPLCRTVRRTPSSRCLGLEAADRSMSCRAAALAMPVVHGEPSASPTSAAAPLSSNQQAPPIVRRGDRSVRLPDGQIGNRRLPRSCNGPAPCPCTVRRPVFSSVAVPHGPHFRIAVVRTASETAVPGHPAAKRSSLVMSWLGWLTSCASTENALWPRGT